MFASFADFINYVFYHDKNKPSSIILSHMNLYICLGKYSEIEVSGYVKLTVMLLC